MSRTELVAVETAPALHPFERAGLGKAPFRCTGTGREIFQAVAGDPNCPIQPGASCAYCGQGIMNVAYITAACGARFKVGCDCVRKTDDPKIVRAVSAFERKLAAKARAAKADRVALELAELISTRSTDLAAQPHPRGRAGETLHDWAVWMFANAGAAGRAKTLKIVRAAVSA